MQQTSREGRTNEERARKVAKIVLDGRGSYLGMEKGCFVVRNKANNVEKYPLFENEIGEVVLKSGNLVSTGALASLGFWDIDVLIVTQKGQPVAMLKGLDDDSHVKTRISQYEASKNGKGIAIAKKIVSCRIERALPAFSTQTNRIFLMASTSRY